MKILIFGDSITWGAWDAEGGWATHIKKQCDRAIIETNYSVYNEVSILGISGNTTTDLLKRFQVEVEARLEEASTLFVIFAVGINDSLYMLDSMKNQVSLDIFEENIETLITQAKRYTGNVLFLGLTPVDDNKVNPVPWYPGGAYTNKWVKMYDEKLEMVCSAKGVDYLTLYGSLTSDDLEDGIHPNTSGHAKISQIVSEYLATNQ